MKRKDFLKRLGLGFLVAPVAGKVVAEAAKGKSWMDLAEQYILKKNTQDAVEGIMAGCPNPFYKERHYIFKILKTLELDADKACLEVWTNVWGGKTMSIPVVGDKIYTHGLRCYLYVVDKDDDCDPHKIWVRSTDGLKIDEVEDGTEFVVVENFWHNEFEFPR